MVFGLVDIFCLEMEVHKGGGHWKLCGIDTLQDATATNTVRDTAYLADPVLTPSLL